MSAVQEYPPLAGWLTTGDGSHKIQVRFASRFSLWAVFDRIIPHLTVENLDVRVGDRIVGLGSCRILSEEEESDHLVWLVPLGSIHDMEALFAREEIRELPVELSSLSLSMDYRQGIDAGFRSGLADLVYELNVYMAQLDKLDAQYRDELPPVQAAIQWNILARAAPKFNESLDAWNRELIRFSSRLTTLH